MRGFEDWTRIVGGILWFSGVAGYLENLDALHSRADEEGAEWTSFLGAWHELLGDGPVTVAQVLQAAKPNGVLHQALPSSTLDRDGTPNNRKLGWALRKKADMRFATDAFRVAHAQEARKLRLWAVKKCIDNLR